MTTDTIEKYYAVLGISESATIMATNSEYPEHNFVNISRKSRVKISIP
jgi:hypothetical protein